MCYVWVAQLAIAALGAMSYVQQGQAQQAQGEFNAQVMERNAQAAENEQANVKDAAAIERRRLAERVRAERGQAKVNATASGIDPLFGTPFDIDQDILHAGRTDAGIVGRNEMTEIGRLDKERADLLDAAKMSRAGGKAAAQASTMAATGSLLEGAASVSSRWIQPKPAAPTAPPQQASSIFHERLHVGG